MSEAKVFPTRLTDEQWAILDPLVPANKPGGRPPEHSRRDLVDAIIYVVRQGCTWRALKETEFPNWNTTYCYFRDWQKDGTWDRIEDRLRRDVRETEGRGPEPTAGIIDSQSVRGTEQPGPRGFDGGKKNHGNQATRVRGHDRIDLGRRRHSGE
jgi:transposase